MDSIRASNASSMSGLATATERPPPVVRAGADSGVRASAAPRVPQVALRVPERPVVAEAEPAFDAGEMRQRLEEATQMLNEQLRSTKTNLAFGVDPVVDRTVITVKDRAGEVVREIPGEVFLRVAHNIERFIRDGADLKGAELDKFL